MSPVIAVDVGRSKVCARRPDGGERRLARGGGLGDPDGVSGVDAAVRAAVGAPGPGWRLAVGAPGVLSSPGEAAALADRLTTGWASAPAEVLVATDVVAWQVGALAGADGTVLSVGTGAVALSAHAGRVRRVDGRGLLLGDEGSGAWLGLAGLRAAARAAEGTGPATALLHDAVDRLGPPPGWAAVTSPGELAGLAELVLGAAGRGDDVAAGIVADAVAALAGTIRAAAYPGRPVTVVGGLADTLGPRLRTAAPELDWRAPAGDACDGLVHLADRPDTAFEDGLHRSRAARPATGPWRPAADAAGPAPTGANDRVAAEVDALPTESARPGSESLDELPTRALVSQLLDAQAGAVPAVVAAAPGLADAVDLTAAALRRGGRLVYTGAGTPGRLAVQDAAELPPTFGADPARFPVLLAGGQGAAAVAVEGAEDDTGAAAAAVDGLGVGPDDVLVGITASGRTPWVVAAIGAARARGAGTVAIVSAAGGPAAAAAQVAVELLTGPEALAGSTRLTAGTAQKVALNTLSTAAMVRTGATYGPWMVGLRATNAKLRRRATRIVRDAAGVDEATAVSALADAGGEVAVALVSALTGLGADAARSRLAAAGSVRAATAGTDR